MPTLRLISLPSLALLARDKSRLNIEHRTIDLRFPIRVLLLQTLKAGFAGLNCASGRSGYGPAARPSISRGRRLTAGSPTHRGIEMPVRAAGTFERSTRWLPRERAAVRTNVKQCGFALHQASNDHTKF